MDDEQAIQKILDAFARNTRLDKKNEVLVNHAVDLLIYDVLPPMKYESAAAYRASWGDWQPATTGEAIFEYQDLKIIAGNEVAYAHGLIRCGGTTPSGTTFEDLVRVTFCLRQFAGQWKVCHQHVSKPFAK